MQKFIFIITTNFLISSFFGKASEEGNLLFEGMGFFVNNIQTDWNSNKNNYRFNGKLKTFELGFKRTKIYFSDKVDKKNKN